MEIPKDLSSLFEEIRNTRITWRIIFKGSYVAAEKIKDDADGRMSESIVYLGMPALPDNLMTTPERFYDTLSQRPNELSKSYLNMLLVLFEPMTGKVKKLIKTNPVQRVTNESERDLLSLAKKTRNCYMHNLDMVDENWLKAYKKCPAFFINHDPGDFKEGDRVPGGMPTNSSSFSALFTHSSTVSFWLPSPGRRTAGTSA